MHVQLASEEQDQNNQYDHAYATDGVIAPVLTVWPSWKTPYKGYDKNYRENEHEHHVLAASLTVAVHCLSASILADAATLQDCESWPPLSPRLLPGGACQFPGGTFTRCGPTPFHGARGK